MASSSTTNATPSTDSQPQVGALSLRRTRLPATPLTRHREPLPALPPYGARRGKRQPGPRLPRRRRSGWLPGVWLGCWRRGRSRTSRNRPTQSRPSIPAAVSGSAPRCRRRGRRRCRVPRAAPGSCCWDRCRWAARPGHASSAVRCRVGAGTRPGRCPAGGACWSDRPSSPSSRPGGERLVAALVQQPAAVAEHRLSSHLQVRHPPVVGNSRRRPSRSAARARERELRSEGAPATSERCCGGGEGNGKVAPSGRPGGDAIVATARRHP
jgi:hypothetical protein